MTLVRVQWPAPPGDVFTPEAAAGLVGQRPRYLGREAEVVEARLVSPTLIDLVLDDPGPPGCPLCP